MSTRESLASLTPDVNWLRLWDDARDYGLQGARALMVNLQILTTPKFENYSCQICGHKLDSKQFPADHIASTHLGCSADHLRDLITSGTCYWTPVTKRSRCLLPSELHFLHLNITQKLHIPGLFTCINIYTHFMMHFLFFAIPCWSRRMNFTLL